MKSYYQHLSSTREFGEKENIRDFIAFPKNNSGRDSMIDSPSKIKKDQLDDLGVKIKKHLK